MLLHKENSTSCARADGRRCDAFGTTVVAGNRTSASEASSPSSVSRIRWREVVVNDQVRGRVVFDNAQLDDLIIARSDGTPTYNFTVVVDDIDMQITMSSAATII